MPWLIISAYFAVMIGWGIWTVYVDYIRPLPPNPAPTSDPHDLRGGIYSYPAIEAAGRAERGWEP